MSQTVQPRLSARPTREDVTQGDCVPWQINPNINPRNNNPISTTSQPYKTYLKQCFEKWINIIYDGQNIFDIIKNRIAIGEISTIEDLQVEYNNINTFIINTFQRVSLDDTVKESYKSYIESYKTAALKQLNQIINNNAAASRRAIAEVTRQPQINITELQESTYPLIEGELERRTSIYTIFADTPTNTKKINNKIKEELFEYIDSFYNDAIGEDEYEEKFKKATFINLLSLFIYILIYIDTYLIRYDYYSDNIKYTNSIVNHINNLWKHIYPDNFNYIDIFKKAFLTFIEIKKGTIVSITPQANSRIRQLTESEWKKYIEQIKLQIVYDLEVQDIFDTEEYRKKLLNRLNEAEVYEKEVYKYLWLFITMPVDYTKYTPIKKLKYKEKRPQYNFQQSADKLTRVSATEQERPLETIESMCMQYFMSSQEYYKSYTKKLVNGCSDITKQCVNLKNARKILTELYKIRKPKSTAHISIEDIFIQRIERENALAILFKKWNEYKDPNDRKDFWIRYFNVTFKDEPGIFIGPGRELLIECLKQLFTQLNNVFIPVEEESVRYTINPEFTAQNSFLEKSKLQTLTPENKVAILEFIGGLFSRCLLFVIDIPIKLSYYTLSYLYYKDDISLDTYSLYYMLDMINSSRPIFNLLNINPDELEYVGLSFNDNYPISSMDMELTKDSLREYINLTGKYVLTKGYSREYKNLLDAFSKGFILSRKSLLENNIHMNVLDKLLNENGGKINDRQLQKFIKKIQVYYSEIRDDMNEEDKNKRIAIINKQKQIYEWFIEILNTDGSDFPYEALGIEKPATSKEQENYMLSQFIPKLLYFWSSSPNINLLEKSSVEFIINDDIGKLPTAHTCTRTIDIPSTYDSYKTLFEKLAIAVYNAQGFGFAGGVKNIVYKCIQSTLKKGDLEKDYNKAFTISVISIIKCHTKLNKKQKKRLIDYVSNNSIDFKNANSRKVKKWGKKLCMQLL